MPKIIWTERPAELHQTALTYGADFVISHRPNKFTLCYRPGAGTPQGEHFNLGFFTTLEWAKDAAEKHLESLAIRDC